MKTINILTNVSKKEIKEAMDFADSQIILPLSKHLSSSINFVIALVGSVSRGMAVHDEKGHFDLDYQIRLRDRPLPDGDEIRSLFLQELRSLGFPQTENSTTALTIRMKKRAFSFDFVLIYEGKKNDLILKRTINPNSPNTNRYVWCPLPSRLSDFYGYFDSLPLEDKESVRKGVIASKKEEYSKSSELRRSGTEIFVQEVQKFYDRTH